MIMTFARPFVGHIAKSGATCFSAKVVPYVISCNSHSPLPFPTFPSNLSARKMLALPCSHRSAKQQAPGCAISPQAFLQPIVYTFDDACGLLSFLRGIPSGDPHFSPLMSRNCCVNFRLFPFLTDAKTAALVSSLTRLGNPCNGPTASVVSC